MARIAPGLTFAALFVAGVLLVGDLLGSFADPDPQFADVHGSAANRTRFVIGGYLMALAGVAFVWFIVPLTHRLNGDGEQSPVIGTARISGAIFASMLIASAAAFMTVAGSITFGELLGDEGQFATGKSALPQLGYVLLLVGGTLAASSTMVAVSLCVRESRTSHKLLRRGGYACALLLPASVIVTPVLTLLPVWTVAASLIIMRRAEPDVSEM